MCEEGAGDTEKTGPTTLEKRVRLSLYIFDLTPLNPSSLLSFFLKNKRDARMVSRASPVPNNIPFSFLFYIFFEKKGDWSALIGLNLSYFFFFFFFF